NNTFITVDEELTYVNYYLEIQKIRFRDRLHYEISIAPDVYQAITIPFLIQTFVENAFKHSFEKYMGEAYLKTTIEKKGNAVHITVWNNSPSRHEELPHESGLGLENITKRLELLFPSGQTSVQLNNLDDGSSVLAIFPFVLKSEI
ncbi:histidine kinase, partial [Neobacillus drentensis]